MIVTGQQPAVGGGPLYTLVKVAHAVALSKQENKAKRVDQVGQPAEPVVFWCASEDHDLGEAGHADVVLRDGSIRRFTSTLGGGRHSLSFRPARLWWDDLFSFMDQQVGPGPGSAFLRAQAPLGDDEGMGAWLCRLITALFPTVEALEGRALRPRWTATMARAVTHWPSAELAELRTRLLAEGAADAFGPLDDPPLFSDLPSGRTALDRSEAQQLLDAGRGADLSPGAALRPVLQQAALPCTTYVGGPGELAYHRFIMPAYAALRVVAPQLVPRCSLTLVPGWCQRALSRWGITADEVATWHAPERVPGPVDDQRLTALDAAMNLLRDEPRVAGSLRRLAAERAHLARRLARLERERLELPALGPLRSYLAPRGGRQERTMSLFQAVWEHGPGLARTLEAAAASTLAVHSPSNHRYVLL